MFDGLLSADDGAALRRAPGESGMLPGPKYPSAEELGSGRPVAAAPLMLGPRPSELELRRCPEDVARRESVIWA